MRPREKSQLDIRVPPFGRACSRCSLEGSPGLKLPHRGRSGFTLAADHRGESIDFHLQRRDFLCEPGDLSTASNLVLVGVGIPGDEEARDTDTDKNKVAGGGQ